jgi:phospholipase C
MSENIGASARYDFLLSRRLDNNDYGLWRIDLSRDDLVTPVAIDPQAQFDRTHQILAIGRYLLEWGPLTLQDYDPRYPYRLFEFDPNSKDPLAAKALQQGSWPKTKFWQWRIDFGNPEGAHKAFQSGDELMLLSMHNFVLNMIPTAGRGTFQLFNFDPAPTTPGKADPLPARYTPQGAFDTIEAGHELIPLGNYVLDRLPDTGEYWLWSFDPQAAIPLALPTIQQGRWPDIDASHKLVAIGDHVLDWIPANRAYRLWRFDPKQSNPLTGPVKKGTLPAAFDAQTTLTGIQPLLPVDSARAQKPGTIDFMRTKIKHVVYLMLENRSFDHICGWLYGKDQKEVHFVGRDGPFNGASLDMFNIDPSSVAKDKRVFLNVYQDGKLSNDWDLDFLPDDPYHNNSDVLRQFFFNNRDGYAQRAKPTMDGFVWNNGVHSVMTTYAPAQLPVMTGLASNFAVSDEWFSSMPGPTDPNRAFAFTGSALGELDNFQNDNQYIYWPYTPRRPSIWKVLWSNGFTDWKIYNSVEWQNFVHTYHLFLQGQIPPVDAHVSDHIASIDQFKKDALAGNLPAFSFLEPIWISLAGTSSYHPGGDLIPGERNLNSIYDALRKGPAWSETLFVITFDEHGGVFDHVPPPYAENPWPNDVTNGFRYDMMGVRVPAIVISPLIEEHTVFRAAGPVPYDLTSILATLLNWYGIPKSRWGLGERVSHAPTFEGTLQRSAPRSTSPAFTPPYDKSFPREGGGGEDMRLHSLHRTMTPWLVAALANGKLNMQDTAKVTDEILENAGDLKTLHTMVSDLAKKLR